MRRKKLHTLLHFGGIGQKGLILLCLLCVSLLSRAQINVTGTIYDENGSSLPGVTVIEKETTNGTISDFDGRYTISIKEGNTVKVSFVGYKSQEIIISASTGTLNINMTPDVTGLDEVVVIGYGTQKRANVTSAVSSVKSEDFLSGNNQDASDLIKGKVAGLVITKASGDPNASASINLRGMVSLKGGSSPLVLVDGIPGDMETVAPENIASIDVLKDASAAAIYGTRGAGGVILITTKNGSRIEKPQIDYSGYLTASNFYKKADFMTAEDIRAGKTNFKDGGSDTDWLKGISQQAYSQNHNVNIMYGTKSASYSAGINYREEQGIIQKTGTENLRINLDINQYFFDDILKFNVNIVKGLHTHDISDPNYTYRQAVIRNPTLPVYNLEDGSYREDFNVLQYYNPIAMINEKSGENKSEWTRLTGNATVEPIKGWKTNLMVATSRSHSNDRWYTTSKYYTVQTANREGEAYQYSYSSQSDYLEATSNYDKTIDKHNFGALVGYSFQDSFFESFWASNYGFPTDYFQYNSLGSGSALNAGKAGMGSDKKSNRLIGFFTRVNYNFNQKYNVLLSIRHEGSSKFGDNYKWGNFPSASVGWTISKESFMENIYWLNHLKLRAGYGVTGVIPNDPYQSLVRFSYSKGNYYDGSEWKKGLGAISNPNPDLKWEKSSEFNIGLDFDILENRISATVDLYQKTTTDMLYEYNVPVPPNLYTSTLANVGEMTNKGIEAMITAIPVKNTDYEWNTSFVLSHNKNELVSLSNDLYKTENYLNTAYASDPISLPTHRVELGMSMGQFWGMKSVGISDNGLWLIENPETKEAVEFTDDIKVDEKYRQFLGSGLPKISIGWNNTFRYKEFDLTVQMSGQFGQKILNGQRMFYQNNSIAYNKLRSASDNLYGKRPLSSSLSQTFVSYFLEDGDYMKIDNITLGYNLKNVKFIKKLRVFVAAENILCITDYTGLDPELTMDFNAAGTDDRNKYPSIRSYTLGLNLTF